MLKRRLIHYSDAYLTKVRSVKPGSSRIYKPVGLWVSVEGEDDWKSWCEAEGYEPTKLACPTEIVLKPNASVLWVSGAAALFDFHEEFKEVAYTYPSPLGCRWGIDWAAVARQYSGLVIAPYVWAWRLEEPVSGWYYGWDCASGCIWDASAVLELKPMTGAVPPLAQQKASVG